MWTDIHDKSWPGFKVTAQSEHAGRHEARSVCQGTMAYCVPPGLGQFYRNMGNFLDPDKITLHFHTHSLTHTLMMCQGQLVRPYPCAVWLLSGLYVYRFTLRHDQAASFWRYLPVAEWMLAFKHLLGPSAHNIKSCQVSFYTVTSTESAERMPEECHCMCKCFRNSLIFTLRKVQTQMSSHFRIMREEVFKSNLFRMQKNPDDSSFNRPVLG